MGYLILMARALTVLSDGLQSLFDQVYVSLVNVETQQPQAACGAAADAVQKLQRLTYQVIVGFVVLVPKEILQKGCVLEIESRLDISLRLDLVMTALNLVGWNLSLRPKLLLINK